MLMGVRWASESSTAWSIFAPEPNTYAMTKTGIAPIPQTIPGDSEGMNFFEEEQNQNSNQPDAEYDRDLPRILRAAEQ